MREFTENGIRYTIQACTAIAAAEAGKGPGYRQPALLVIADNGTETTEHIVFGWELPTDPDTFRDMCDDPAAWEPITEEHETKTI